MKRYTWLCASALSAAASTAAFSQKQSFFIGFCMIFCWLALAAIIYKQLRRAT